MNTELVYAALARAKKNFDAVVKDRENDFFKSTYATLGSVMRAVNSALDVEGLMYTHTGVMREAEHVCVLTLVHIESGQALISEWPVRPVKRDPQGEGSAWTYIRRYSLMGMFGLNAEDDDGNAATQHRPSKDWVKELTKAKSAADCRAIWELAREAGDLDDTLKKMITDRGAAFTADEEAKAQAEPTVEGVTEALGATAVTE